MPIRPAPLGLVLLTLASPVQAQGPDDSALRELAQADTTSPAARYLLAGFAELRAGSQAPERNHLDAALAAFCRAAESRAGWWMVWYGIGRAQLALEDGHFPVRPAACHTEGASYIQDAGIAFARALTRDSSRTEAALGLLEALEKDRRWGLGTVARDAFRRFATSGVPQPARILLIRAVLERDGGDRDLVIPLLEGYLAAGGDSGIGLIQLARERYRIGDPSANATYWAGVDRVRTGEAMALLRTQLAQIAAPGEMAPWDTLSESARPAWVRRFWTRRDVADGLEPGTRLAEHFKRLEVASRGFKWVGFGMAGDTLGPAYKSSQSLGRPKLISGERDNQDPFSQMDLWSEQSLLYGMEVTSEGGFDPRGTMYLRHGPPDDMAGPFWLYRRNGEEYLVAVDLSFIGTACDISPRYCFYQVRGRIPPIEQRRRWKREWDQMYRELSVQDGKPRHFAHDFPVAARFYALPRAESLDGELLVALAIPASKLAATRNERGTAYRLRLRLVAAPPDGATRVDLDTTRTLVVSTGDARREWLQLVQALPLTPGPYVARLTITQEDTTRGVVLAVDSLLVGNPAEGPVLSDVILSRENSTLTWTRGRQSVRIDPTGTVSRRDTLQLYYEVAGLTGEGAYRTSVELVRVSGDKERTELTLSFSDQVEGPVVRAHRQFGLDRVRPGNYIVRVTVETNAGRLVRRAPVTITD